LEGALTTEPSFSIESVMKPVAALSPEVAHGFLAQYAASFRAAGMVNSIMRYDGGSEVDADEVLVSFGRQFVVVPDMKPAGRRRLWSMARNRDLQLGMPIVLARSEDATMYEADAPHVYVVEVPEQAQALFTRICEARAFKPEELEAVAVVYLPAAGSGWPGRDGRLRVSQLDSDVQNVLPMIAPLRKGQAEAWYHVVRAAVRHLWLEANPPVRSTANVPLDELDAAEYASLLATGGEEAF
jgi:hypothetical protein